LASAAVSVVRRHRHRHDGGYNSGVRELVPGLLHWTAVRETIGLDVSSYYHARARVLVDPMTPPDGMDALARHGTPEEILLTSRHHLRHGERFGEAFGCTVRCHRLGLHEFTHGEDVRPFEFGDTLKGGIVAHEVGALTPEETALHLPDLGAVALGDSLVRDGDGPLEFVPPWLMGDDPEGVQAGLLEAFRRLLALDWDTLLLAHGDPWVGGAKDALRGFVAEPRVGEW
jgi:hypothetical protein